ncbi:hypothetical protein LTR10_007719 [Elasticomyces elasticus]|nr:hypothetical protein LTR10_007719 [Elasticomyces elasticus]KAK4970720.1 hypothetical protein LTR42_007696 [Elasticomyces elasticus]
MEAGSESPLRFSPLPPDPDDLINLPTLLPDDPEPVYTSSATQKAEKGVHNLRTQLTVRSVP